MANWRHSIDVSNLNDGEENNSTVRVIANAIADKLKSVKEIEEKVAAGEEVEGIKYELDEDMMNELDTHIENFEFIVKGIDENLNPEEYSLDSWLDGFNDYLEQLYDFGDILLREGPTFAQNEKMMFITIQ